MRMKRNDTRENKQGFTLVELIVVLVILAILAAIMVPALLGWIDKAKNKDAILECRSVVMAAQGQLAEAYGKGVVEEADLESELNQEHEAILKIAGISDGEGTIVDRILVENHVIDHLKYTKKKTEVTVTYEYNNGNPVYQIGESSRTPSTGIEYENSLTSGLKKDGLIDENGKVTEKLEQMVEDNNKLGNNSQGVQNYFWEQLGKEEFPKLTKQEQDEIIKKAKDSGLTGAEAYVEDAIWKPIVTQEGNVILVAIDKSQQKNQNKVGLGDAYGGVICYNGEYYVKLGSTGTTVKNKWVSDKIFSVSELNDHYVADQWVKLPINRNEP